MNLLFVGIPYFQTNPYNVNKAMSQSIHMDVVNPILVGGIPTPLKKYVSVGVIDIPNWMKSH